VQKADRQATVVFLGPSELPSRAAVEAALGDIGATLQWHEEHELESTLALSILIEDIHVGVSIVAAPLPPALYEKHLAASGLDAGDQERVAAHGSHARIISMKTETPAEPADRMWMVYRVAVRLCGLGGVAVLAPASGVFALGVDTAYVDARRDDNVPPMDLWVQAEMGTDGIARSRGAFVSGVPDVELSGLDVMEPGEIYSTIMDMLVFLRQIRRELVTGESLHVGAQGWDWKVTTGDKELVKFVRVSPGSE
jgi:hypothetical protein